MLTITNSGYKLADLLTFTRLIIVIFMLSLVPKGISAFDTFMFFLLAAWLTDVLDGFFARLSKKPGYLKDWDGWVDTGMYITTFLYSTVLGVYSLKFFVIIVLLNFFAVLITRNLEVNQAFHFLYIILGFRTLVKLNRSWMLVVLIWTLFVILFKRERLKEQIVNFISSWKRLLFSK